MLIKAKAYFLSPLQMLLVFRLVFFSEYRTVYTKYQCNLQTFCWQLCSLYLQLRLSLLCKEALLTLTFKNYVICKSYILLIFFNELPNRNFLLVLCSAFT